MRFYLISIISFLFSFSSIANADYSTLKISVSSGMFRGSNGLPNTDCHSEIWRFSINDGPYTQVNIGPVFDDPNVWSYCVQGTWIRDSFVGPTNTVITAADQLADGSGWWNATLNDSSGCTTKLRSVMATMVSQGGVFTNMSSIPGIKWCNDLKNKYPDCSTCFPVTGVMSPDVVGGAKDTRFPDDINRVVGSPPLYKIINVSSTYNVDITNPCTNRVFSLSYGLSKYVRYCPDSSKYSDTLFHAGMTPVVWPVALSDYDMWTDLFRSWGKTVFDAPVPPCPGGDSYQIAYLAYDTVVNKWFDLNDPNLSGDDFSVTYKTFVAPGDVTTRYSLDLSSFKGAFVGHGADGDALLQVTIEQVDGCFTPLRDVVNSSPAITIYYGDTDAADLLHLKGGGSCNCKLLNMSSLGALQSRIVSKFPFNLLNRTGSMFDGIVPDPLITVPMPFFGDVEIDLSILAVFRQLLLAGVIIMLARKILKIIL
jgi:hypothetical protein